jgi:hypothetical protein
MEVRLLTPKVVVETWAEYPPGSDMAAACDEQRRLGNRVLEVRGCAVKVVVGDNTPQLEELLEAELRRIHRPKVSVWLP